MTHLTPTPGASVVRTGHTTDVQAKAANATPAQRLSALLRRPAFLGALVLVVTLAVVWGAMLFSSGQPQTLDSRAVAVESQLLLPGGDGETLVNAASPQADLMRQVIYEQLASGHSEQQVIAYMEQHYGQGILAQPPFDGFTVLIWVVPGMMLLVGAGVVFLAAREWQAASGGMLGRSVGARHTTRATPLQTATKTPQTTSKTMPTATKTLVNRTDDQDELSEAERAHWLDVLARELAAEEGLPPHSGHTSGPQSTRITRRTHATSRTNEADKSRPDQSRQGTHTAREGA